MASRGRLLWLQKEARLYRSGLEIFFPTWLIYYLKHFLNKFTVPVGKVKSHFIFIWLFEILWSYLVSKRTIKQGLL